MRQIVATVVRSTFHFSAASRWVYCPVSTATNISYFWLGASKRRHRHLLAELTVEFEPITSLQTYRTRPPLAGYFRTSLAH